MAIKQKAQMQMDEEVVIDFELVPLLRAWDETRYAVKTHNAAAKEIKTKAAEWEPGRYRCGGYVIEVGTKRTVSIESIPDEEDA